MSTQVRMEVGKVTSANVHYLSKRLGITIGQTYALIVSVFLFERDLDTSFINLSNFLFTVGEVSPDDGDIPQLKDD